MIRSNKKWLYVAKLLIAIALICLLAYKVDWKRAWHSLQSSNYLYIFVALVISFFALLFAAARWSRCLQHFGYRLHISTTYKGYLLGLFYNVFFPGAIGGDVVRVGFAWHRGANSLLRVTMSVFIERVLGLLATLVIGCVGLWLVGKENNLGNLKVIIPLTCIALFVGLTTFRPLSVLVSNKIKRKFSHVTYLKKLSDAVHSFSTMNTSTVLLLFTLSLLFQLGDIVASYFWAKAIHIDQPLSVFLLVIPIAFIATVLPISVGGLGVREGMLSLLLYKFGVPLSDGILLAFMLYLHRVFLGMPGGILQLVGTKRQRFSWSKSHEVTQRQISSKEVTL